MTENRTPIQISGNRVLCADGTLWRWCDGDFMFGTTSQWVKLPPVPTDEFDLFSVKRGVAVQELMRTNIEILTSEEQKLAHF